MRKVLEINNPSEEEMSTEPKKIVHDNLHAYEHTTTRNYDQSQFRKMFIPIVNMEETILRKSKQGRIQLTRLST